MLDPLAWQSLGASGTTWLWFAASVSFGLFCSRIGRYVRVLRSARPENRFDQPGRRSRLFFKNVFLQPRLLEEQAVGAAHLAVFWSFVAYATTFFWNLAKGLAPALPIPYPDDVRWVGLVLVVCGFIGLAGVAVAAARRYLYPPKGLEKSADATVILMLISTLLVFSLLGAWARSRGDSAVAAWMWWGHMLTVLGFLAYLPYSKHMHLLASPFNVWFAPLQAGALLPGSEGASKREEFTWKQLLNGFACAECGRCERACPQNAAGHSLSPKLLMHAIKEAARASRNGHSLAGEVVSAEAIWGCATCLACMQQCPVFNEHVPVLIEMRRHLMSAGAIDGKLQEALTSLTRYGNAFGLPARARTRWMAGLDGALADARKQPVEYLWLTGDTAALDARQAPVARAFVSLLRRANVDFGTLYEGESNAGNDVRRAGEEGLFESLRDKNLKALAKAHFLWIVTTDPHTYHALKNDYPDEIAKRVLHSTELLAQLLHSGRLVVGRAPEAAVTYHDACYLGRYNGLYDPPRAVLKELGARVVEMPRNRAASFCCGAGGGRIWMQDAGAQQDRPAVMRVREAASLAAARVLSVACPKDYVMFEDAIKTAGLEDRLVVKDLIELTEEATRPAERNRVYAA